MSCIHTLLIYGETHVKQRDGGRQPFAEISIINTQTTGDRRDRKRKEGTQREWKHAEKTNGEGKVL